jgi:hypothetical protein
MKTTTILAIISFLAWLLLKGQKEIEIDFLEECFNE